MTITMTGNVQADEKTERYVQRAIGSLEKYLPKEARDDARAAVILAQVDRPHGNKYEASVNLTAHSKTYSASDSTLNLLAALDIVRLKLINQLKKS